MNLFRLLLKLQEFPISAATKKLDSLANLSEAGMREYQKQARWDIFNYHIENNAWYESFINHQAVSAWKDIPLVSKTDIQRPLSEIVTGEYLQQRVYRNNTSGSTGIPFYFAKDKFCHAMTWAYIFKCYNEIGLEYGNSLQARFFGIPLSKKGYLKEKVKDWFASRMRFPIFDLSDGVLEGYLKKFFNVPFDYIYGYTSSLVLFARFVKTQGVVLNTICPTLRRCIVTSEVCSREDRKLLEDAFGVRVTNEYGAAELDIIAFEDDHGNWLLNEENLYIEILDENNEQVQPGVEGEVVVTSLYNRAMPLVRYKLGDRMVLSGERVCGRRVVKEMTGRTNDVALLPSGRKAPGLTFYYVSKSLLEQSGSIREFIIKQVAPIVFHFEYVADNELSEEQQQQVQKLMDEYLEPGLKATFERKVKIERTEMGKFKHFQYLVR